MGNSFQDYWQARKPVLDEAFQREISRLLENMPSRQTAALMATLMAGKKIRGCLSCLVSDALGGTLAGALPRAVAVEMIQAATLIHDDFVDQDAMRGKRPAAWTLEGGRRAVLIGDVIFATAIKRMNDLSRADGLAVSQAIAQVARGALHEPLEPFILAEEIESGRMEGAVYEKIIRLKTGILFGTACHLGALATQANGRVGEISFRYGMSIGEAYQIADDCKEVEHHLVRGSIDPGQMAALTPALLYFVPDMRPHILAHLQGESPNLSASEAEFFRMAEKLMKGEIEKRLQASISEMAGNFPEGEFGEMMRQAPWDLIRMFNES